jgi:beta-1,4-mannosyltransferase
MKIAFSPYKNDTNKYIKILINLLERKGNKVIPLRRKEIFFSTKIVHLNWFELVNSNSKFGGLSTLFVKILVLFFFRVFSIKIGTTFHNRAGHDKNTQDLQNILMRLTLKLSSFVIIHSRESKQILSHDFKINDEEKFFYVPHPNYIDVYGKILPSTDETQRLRLLFLGAVKPYKNLELLIDIVKQFPDHVELTIAGVPKSGDYAGTIKKHTQDLHNVTLDLRFIADSEIPAFLSACDILVLPYDMSSSLNSGSAYLAFSYGKTVICPEIGTINDLEDKSYVLTYTYKNREEHIFHLTEKIKEAIGIWKEDKNCFTNWGLIMRNYMEKEHSDEKVISGLLCAYSHVKKRR